MTVTMEFRPEVEAGLVARAESEGVSIERYVERLVERSILEPVTRGTELGGKDLSAEDWVREFRAWIKSHRGLPVLSDEAMGRDAIYGDRGL